MSGTQASLVDEPPELPICAPGRLSLDEIFLPDILEVQEGAHITPFSGGGRKKSR